MNAGEPEPSVKPSQTGTDQCAGSASRLKLRSVPDALRDTVRAELLILSSKKRQGDDLQQLMIGAYEATKSVLVARNVEATDRLITESVPVWVLEGAIELGWVSNPPHSWLPCRYTTVYRNGECLEPGPLGPEPSVRLGSYEMPESFRAWFSKILEPSIAGWQGEELRRASAITLSEQRPAESQIQPLRSDVQAPNRNHGMGDLPGQDTGVTEFDKEAGDDGLPSLKLNVRVICDWLDKEGWENETLAEKLDLSARTVSSLRNNGNYHGRKAVAKLANLMGCDPVDLYLQPEAST
jgi:hypothetical protein